MNIEYCIMERLINPFLIYYLSFEVEYLRKRGDLATIDQFDSAHISVLQVMNDLEISAQRL